MDRDFLRTFVKKINPKTHTLREINFGQIPTVGTESQPSASIRKSQEEEFATINKKTEIEETPEVEEVREEIFDDEELSKEKKSVKKSTVKKEEKINLDDIDKKLDEMNYKYLIINSIKNMDLKKLSWVV